MAAGRPNSPGALLNDYYACAREAAQALLKNWLIIPASAAAYLCLLLARFVLSPWGIAGGFILGLIQVALLTFYYGWLRDSRAARRPMKLADYLQFDVALFSSIISVAFIIWIVEWISASLVQGLNAGWFVLCVNLALVLIFNALPEFIYLNRNESFAALQESASFTYRYWLEWYLPFALLLLPFFLTAPVLIPIYLGASDPLLPVYILFNTPSMYFRGLGALSGALIGLIVAHWFMLFRASLFEKLERSGRRLF